MYSSSSQPTYNYDAHGKYDQHPSHSRYGQDNASQVGEHQHSDSTTTGSSWNHYPHQHQHHEYALDSPTSATSPSYPMQPNSYPSMITPPPTATPYVLSHSSDNTNPNSMDSTAGTSSYGYGLSQRGFFPRPKLTTTLWEDERTICFQVDANGICVARREDNDMINGTKLLNVAGMSRGRRDGILKNEKGRVVVKVGAMHLKGVWVTFDRAKALAAQFKIQTTLYPLFVDNPQSFLYSHPITSPISRLGSFRPFYPSSYDRPLSSPPSSQVGHQLHHTGVDPSSPPNAPTPASYGYRPGSTPGAPALPPQSISSYGLQTYANDTNGGDGPTNELTMEYRSGAPPPTLETLTNHESPYYNHLLDSNPRSSELSFHDTNNKDKMMISTALSGPPSSSHDSFMENHMDAKRTNGVPLGSAFQPLDSTSPGPPFHHPPPLYTDSMSSSSNSSSSRDPYHHQSPSPTSHPPYLANPLSVGSNSNLLNGTDSDNKDSRVMGHSTRTNRHHPYNLPKNYTSPYANSVMLKKPPSSRHSGSPSKSLVKEIGSLSVKTEPDYLGRPW